MADRRRVLLVVKVLFALAVAWFAGRVLVTQWASVRDTAADLEVDWLLIVAASAIVFATYALLTEAWRLLVLAWGRPLGYRRALRIWFISALGRYVPGKVWQMGTMAVMVQREGVSGTAGAGAALIITVVNTIVGFGVVATFGIQLLEIQALGIAIVVLAAAGVLLAPMLLPWAATTAARVSGREIVVPTLPHRTLWFGIIASAAAWIAYGVAFHLLTHGVLGFATGGVPASIAIFTFSYLLGFLALISPGGIVVREVALVAALVNTGMDEGSAIVLAVVSRLWLTVLEILPAMFFLAHDQLRARFRNTAHENPG